MMNPTESAGRVKDFQKNPRGFLIWIFIAAFGIFVIIFSAFSSSILAIQKNIVDATNETQDVIVPLQQAQLRTVRNLEMLRHYGNLAAKATDPTARQDAAFLASMAALSPLIEGDISTEQLVADANRSIADIAARDIDLALWPAMEDRLTQRADDITADSAHLALQRAIDIRDDSLRARDISFKMAILFVVSMIFMAVLGMYVYSALRRKQVLFNEASHDFRHRLHGMQLLLNNAERISLQSGLDIIAKMKAVNADLQRYIENFLELARLDAGVQSRKPQHEVLHLQYAFQYLEFQFEEISKSHGIDLKFRNTSLLCKTDERLMLKILENLITNALKFAKKRVLVAARRRAGCVEVWVIDDGPGMPSFEKRSIWDAFIQGHSSETTGFDMGYGLGMSIVMRCSYLLKAKIDVKTKAGHGSLVRVGFSDTR